MNVATVARYLNAHPHSVRRWASEYARFLTDTAAPEKGIEREFGPHDLKVLNYVALARKNKRLHEDIERELEAMQRLGWESLPGVPDEWLKRPGGLIPVAEAGERTQQIAELAQYKVRNQTLEVQLADAQEKALTLERRLDEAQHAQHASEVEIADLRVQLATIQGQVDTLRARLGAYALRGSEPVPLAVLIGAVVLATAVILLLVFAIALGLSSL